MLRTIGRLVRRLIRSRGGNATMMVALSLPALIGTSGLGVDMAQWYMWKRELQYAVDQAAMAGAFARASEETRDTYVARANQEYSANLSTIADISAKPAVSLADFNGGDDNSVIVTSSATNRLPFSSFLTNSSVTVAVSAQAAFTEGEKFTSCIIAVDEDDDGALTIGGSTKLTARCGLAALSTSDEAVVINGNPELDPGWVVAAGGIDDWLEENTDAAIHEYEDDLVDPFADLTPPKDSRPRTYSKSDNCKTSTTNTATGTITTTITTKVYTSNKKNDITDATLVDTIGPVSIVTTVNRPAGKNESDDHSTSTTTSTDSYDNGKAADPRYKITISTTVTANDITIVTTTQAANTPLQPGTYSDLTLQCDAVLQPGIYVIDGGSFATNAQYSLLGNGVMIVLKNGADIKINGGANINLTAMTSSQLRTAYTDTPLSNDDADKLSNMLVFEDRSSQSQHGNIINGNSSTILNGTVYLPNSNLQFSGSATVTSQCLMLAASTITLTGDTNMSSFCPDGMFEDTNVTTGEPRVRLVS